MILAAFMCLFPMIHVLAVSFSSASAAGAGWVTLWPVDFTTLSYEHILRRDAFWQSMWISFQRIFLGGLINLVLTVLVAYPLSKESRTFRWRTVYAWFFFFTMLFGGGLIPWFINIRQLGLLGTIWALVLPSAVPVFSVVLLLNFFRQIPKGLEEAAFIDGASHWRILFQIFIPISTPAIATIVLFSLVGHWNSWFDGLILARHPADYPMQTFLQTIVIAGADLMLNLSASDAATLAIISDRTVIAAQIFIGALPIIVTYPFLQKYFAKGIVVGSVKG